MPAPTTEDGMNTTELGGHEVAGDKVERHRRHEESPEQERRTSAPSPEGQDGEAALPGALIPPPFEQQEPPFTD